MSDHHKLLNDLLQSDPKVAVQAAKTLAYSGDRTLIPALYEVRAKSLEGSEEWGEASLWRTPSMIERIIISLMSIEECKEAYFGDTDLLSKDALERRVYGMCNLAQMWGDEPYQPFS